MCVSPPVKGRYFHTWRWQGRSPGLIPFLSFSDPCGSLFDAQLDLIDPPPFLWKIIGLSLSHLVPEIIWSKVGQSWSNISPNLSFDRLTIFKHFVSIVSLIFDPVNLLFFIDLRSFWPLIFPKSYILLGPFYIMRWTPHPLPKNRWSTPPPLPLGHRGQSWLWYIYLYNCHGRWQVEIRSD